MTVTNLLNSEDSDFEAGTVGGWLPTVNATMANSTAQANTGTHSLAATVTATGGVVAQLTCTYLAASLVAGNTFQLSASMWRSTSTGSISINWEWRDSTGNTVISSTPATTVTAGPGTWTTLTSSAVAPAGAAVVRLRLTVVGATVGEVLYFDTVSFGALAPQPGAYCASPAQLVLALPGGPALDLMSGRNGYRISSFDLGFPATRDDVVNLPQRDGVVDQTKYASTRAVTIGGSIVPSAQGSRQKALGALGRYLDAAARPTLAYAVDGDMATRVVNLRAADLTAAYTDTNVSAFSAGFKSTDPALYAAATQIAIATASPQVACSYVSNGDQVVYPLLRVYGPVGNLGIIHNPGGGAPSIVIQFATAWTVAAGVFVDIDCNRHTILTNGDPAQPAWNQVTSFGGWPYLVPGGTSQTGFNGTPSGPTGVTRIEVRFADAFLL